MKITGPFYDETKADQPKPWFLRVSLPKKNPDGTVILNPEGRVILRRWRPFYSSKAKAAEDIPAIAAQYGAAGASTGGGVVTRAQAAEFEEAKRLAPEVSLVDLAKYWRLHHPLQETARVRELVERCTAAARLRVGESAHWEDLKSRLGIFAATFGDRIPETITRKEVMDWLLTYPGRARSGRTLLNLKRAVCNFFNWLRTEDLVTQNPAAGIKRRALPKFTAREIRFLSLADTEAYLRACERYDPELVAHEIIQLLAGVRADDEMANFNGDWVLPQTCEVVIPAEIAKTGKREVISGLEENFWAWWRLYGRGGILRPANYPHRWLRVRVLARAATPARADELARLTPWALAKSAEAAAAKTAWPWNARRRTFCTFHVAKHQSADRTALILRHRGAAETLHNSYRGTGATEEQGAAYFALQPRKVRTPVPPSAARPARGIVRFRAARARPASAAVA